MAVCTDPKAPTDQFHDMIVQFAANYPELVKSAAGNILPAERGMLEANKALAPEYAKLSSDLSKLAVQADLDTLRGPGKDLAAEALAQQMVLDPEFFAGRKAAGEGLGKLINSIDVSGGLSGSERAEVERATNRANVQGGTDVKSATTAAANAMNFGNAGTQKQLAKQSALTNAINAGSGFLSQSRSGINPLAISADRAQGNFSPRGSGAFAANLTSNALGQAGSMQQQQTQINADRRGFMEKSMPDISC